MVDFDSLKNDAEKEVQDHPQQVKEGEQNIEKKLGLGGQDSGQQGQDNAGGQQASDSSNSGQQASDSSNSGQQASDSAGQGQ
jgi:hypothetical protein